MPQVRRNLTDSPATFVGSPTSDVVDPTGFVAGPLGIGRWLIFSSVDCYFLRGTSSLAVGDVKVDEATPDLSHPITGGTYLQIDVTGSNDNYIAFKSISGGPSGPVILSR